MISFFNFSKNKYFSRFNFLLANYKNGNILDLGNLGGIEGEGKSDSFHVSFRKQVESSSTVYGFDLFLPKDVSFYPNQEQGNVQEHLPYQNSFFDTVYMGELIEHLDSPGLALQEIFRVLKTNGILIIDTPNPYSIYRIFKYMLQRREDLGDRTHLLFFTPASLVAMLKKFSFEIVFLGTKQSNKIKFLPSFFLRGLGSHLLVVAKKI